MNQYTAAAVKLLGRRLDDMAERIKQARSTQVDDFDGLLGIGYDLTSVREHLFAAEAAWVSIAVAADASWKQIGDALGMSKQAAHKRFAGILVDQPIPGI
jgi:hypothetical protein